MAAPRPEHAHATDRPATATLPPRPAHTTTGWRQDRRPVVSKRPLPSGVCSADRNVRAAPARIMIDGQSSQRYVPAAPPSGLAFTACQVQHARATVELTRHPCQLAAHFLPCARPPDLQFRRSQHYHSVFVTTSARTDNMPRQRDGDKPYSRTVLTRVEFEMLTRRRASLPRTPGRIH